MASETITLASPSSRTWRARRARGLSVVCLTRGPGPRVAALLEPLRRVADEIVVALDDRADDATRDQIARVADRILLYPYAEPVDRPLPRLFRECHGDWLLAIDDDELPSPSLVAALPALCAADDVTHYSIPRRWLYPDTTSFLDDAPWRPDYQLRLVRTDPRFIRFSEELHRPIVASGPGRFLEQPLWHLDPVLRSHDERLAKARRYEDLRPGMRVCAHALNVGFYVPEARHDARLGRVPRADREEIERVLAAQPTEAPACASFGALGRDAIDASWPSTDAEAQQGSLELLERPRDLVAGEQRTLDVRVHNSGTAAWPWGNETVPLIQVASRWFDTNGRELEESRLMTSLPAPILPGTSDLVPAHVVAPAAPGRYRVELDLVHEHVRWFGVAVDCAVLVRRRKRVAALGTGALDAAVAATERLPELEPLVLLRSPAPVAHGYEERPDARAFLFDAAPRPRLLFQAVLVLRSLRLLAAAAGWRSGLHAHLSRGGHEFLRTVAECDVLVAGDERSSELRERWAHAVTVRAAVLAGVPVARADTDEILRLLGDE
jgi:hypothetical protein